MQEGVLEASDARGSTDLVAWRRGGKGVKGDPSWGLSCHQLDRGRLSLVGGGLGQLGCAGHQVPVRHTLEVLMGGWCVGFQKVLWGCIHTREPSA